MAIENINTLQGNILTSYNNAALANLGQRLGAKGDSIKVISFEFKSLIKSKDNSEIPSTIVLSYNDVTNELTLNSGNLEFIPNTNIISQFTVIEYLGLTSNNLFTNCSIDKVNGIYRFKGLIKDSSTNEYITIIEFGVNSNNTNIENFKCILIKNGTEVNIYDGTSCTLYNTNTEFTISTNGLSYDSIITDIQDITGSIADTTIKSIIENYFKSVLPKYIIDVYNSNTYIYDDNIGLKREIVENLVKFLYEESKVDGISENNPFFVYIPKNFTISFYVNDNTGEYYDSYPINAKFIIDNGSTEPNSSFADASTNNYIIVDSTIEKAGAFKTIINYGNYDNINVISQLLYYIPYIGSDNYWYINDIKTEVNATGKDAGNPNIIILQTSIDNSVITATSTYNKSVYFTQSNPSILHTYENILVDYVDDNNKLEFVDFNYILSSENTNVAESNITGYTFSVKLPKLYENSNDATTFKGLVNDVNFDSIIKNSLIFYIIDNRLSYNNEYSVVDKTIKDVRNTSLQYKLTENVNEQSFTTVLFQIVLDENNLYKWQPIQYNNSVLDLGRMIASPEFARLFVRNEYKPDQYEYSHLIFDNVKISLKNTPLESPDDVNYVFSKRVYPVLKNDDNSYFTSDTIIQRTNTDTQSINIPNNLNFTPKFAYITGVDNDNSSSDYLGPKFEIQDTGSSQKFITFDSTTSKFCDDTSVSPNSVDYIPMAKWSTDGQVSSSVFPMFDFREVITNNQTALNRISLISLTSSGQVYNAYIGNSASTTSQVGTLYIGSSPTNYSMAANKTLTNDYDKFKTFKKVKFELPVETEQLTIYKSVNTVTNTTLTNYFTYINVPFVIDNDNGFITATTSTITSAYMDPVTVSTYTFKCKKYLESTYTNFIIATAAFENIPLSNTTYSSEPNDVPKSVMFMLNLAEFTTGKYNVSSVEQIADSSTVLDGIFTISK